MREAGEMRGPQGMNAGKYGGAGGSKLRDGVR
jgi:hypothetical protein